MSIDKEHEGFDPTTNRRVGMIASLDVNETLPISRRLGTDSSVSDIADTQRQLGNTINSAVVRARKRVPEHKFTVDCGFYVTRDHTTVVVANVTRVA